MLDNETKHDFPKDEILLRHTNEFGGLRHHRLNHKEEGKVMSVISLSNFIFERVRTEFLLVRFSHSLSDRWCLLNFC